MGKLKKEWIKEWSIKDIIEGAIRHGMEFMAEKIDIQTLDHNQDILIKELKNRINEK